MVACAVIVRPGSKDSSRTGVFVAPQKTGDERATMADGSAPIAGKVPVSAVERDQESTLNENASIGRPRALTVSSCTVPLLPLKV